MQIAQAGLALETPPGKSRTDGKDDGSPVFLANTGGGTTLFQLLWTPPGDTTAVASLGPGEGVWSFVPTARQYGTYLIELVRNSGLVSETRERRTFTVRTPGGLVIPALNERGNRLATLVEPGEPNDVDNNSEDWPDPALAALNFAAWWRSQHELFMAADWLIAPVRVTLAHENDGGAVVRTAYRTIGAALAAGYPSSHASVAVYEIEPLVFEPADEGPYTLDSVVTYVFRAARGRESGVHLPALDRAGDDIICESVTLRDITGSAALQLYDCRGAPAIEASSCGMERCWLDSPTITIGGGLTVRDCRFSAEGGVAITCGDLGQFDRCRFDTEATITTSSTSVTLVDCTFADTPTVVFSGAPGVLHMDARSNYLWAGAGGAVTNGTITVEALP